MIRLAVEAGLPTLSVIIFTAIVDSINPCAIGVMILLLSSLIVNKRKERIITVGSIYIFAVFLTYLTFGLGLTTFLAVIPIVWAEYISLFVGMLVVIAGIIEIKDFFWYGQGVSLMIPEKYSKIISEKMKTLSIPTVVGLGIFVSSVELPCTGGPYLAITLLLSQNFNLQAFFMLVLYNIIFVAPLIAILIAVLLGVKVQDLQAWKQGNKAYMRYFTGLVLIGLGWVLMLIAAGVINLN